MRTKLQRLEDALDDTEDYQRRFRRLLSPSERRATHRRIDRLQARIDRCRARHPLMKGNDDVSELD